MNTVLQMGRWTGDPKISYSKDGLCIANANIAVDRRIKVEGQPEADFFKCVAFGKNAEFMEKYHRKGMKVVIQGELQNDNYTDNNGNKVYGNKIVIEKVEFAESKKASANDSSYNAPSRPEPSAAGDGFMNIPDGIDEELPFN